MKADFGLNSAQLGAEAYVLEVGGELDLHTSPRLRSRIGELVASGATELIVDLTETTFVDSTALHVLLDARKRLGSEGGELIVLCPSPHVRRVFEVTGVDGLLRLCSSLELAVDALQASPGSPAA